MGRHLFRETACGGVILENGASIRAEKVQIELIFLAGSAGNEHGNLSWFEVRRRNECSSDFITLWQSQDSNITARNFKKT
jgi:hypothetical protein